MLRFLLGYLLNLVLPLLLLLLVELATVAHYVNSDDHVRMLSYPFDRYMLLQTVYLKHDGSFLCLRSFLPYGTQLYR